MSGLIMLSHPDRSPSQSRLEAVALASPGRGPITDIHGERQFLIGVQGAARIYRCKSSIVAVHGWAYHDSGAATRQLTEVRDLAHFLQLSPLLGGEFALIIFDRLAGRLAAFRSASASVPLHYNSTGGDLVLASDARQVSVGSGEGLTLNKMVLRNFHQTMALPIDAELYRGVRQVPVGVIATVNLGHRCHIEVAAGDHQPQQPYNLGSSNGRPTREQILELTLDAVKLSVQQSTHEKSLGLMLSGGMDSNLILHTLKNETNQWHAYARTFPGLACDESATISKSVKPFAGRLSTLPIDIDDMQRSLADIFSRADYPAFPTQWAIFPLVKIAAAGGCDTLLDGNGGDELFDWPLSTVTNSCGNMGAALYAFSVARRHYFWDFLWNCARIARALTMSKTKEIRMLQDLSERFHSAGRRNMFYLAYEQLLSSTGVEPRSPLRDPRLIAKLAPFLPAASFLGGRRRGLESQLLEIVSSGALQLQHWEKIDFNEVNSFFGEPDPVLGTCLIPRMAGFLPAFIKHKTEREGVSLT